jgi:hypothetical protein
MKFLRKGAGIGGKELWQIGVLEIADPAGNPEMHQVRDRHETAAFQVINGLVREIPIKAFRPAPCAADGRAVAQEADPEAFHQIKVGSPQAVMMARLHLIDPQAAVFDGGAGTFNSGCEHEHGATTLNRALRCSTV